MSPPHHDYSRGLRNGRTEATLESIARSLDEIRDRLDHLPCVTHGQELSDLRRWVVMLSCIGGALDMAGLGVLIKLALG